MHSNTAPFQMKPGGSREQKSCPLTSLGGWGGVVSAPRPPPPPTHPTTTPHFSGLGLDFVVGCVFVSAPKNNVRARRQDVAPKKQRCARARARASWFFSRGGGGGWGRGGKICSSRGWGWLGFRGGGVGFRLRYSPPPHPTTTPPPPKPNPTFLGWVCLKHSPNP